VSNLTRVTNPHGNRAEVVLPRFAVGEDPPAHVLQPGFGCQRAGQGACQRLGFEVIPPTVAAQQEGIAFQHFNRAYHRVRFHLLLDTQGRDELVLLRVRAQLVRRDDARLQQALHHAVVDGDDIGAAVADAVEPRIADMGPQRVACRRVYPQHDDRAVHA
jgi:hypothetical protein